MALHWIPNVTTLATLRARTDLRQGLYALCYVNRRPEMICDNNRTPAKPLILPMGESIKLGKFEVGFDSRMRDNDRHFYRCYRKHPVRDDCFLAEDRKTLLHLDCFSRGWLLDLSVSPGRAEQYETRRWIHPLRDYLAGHGALAHFVAPPGAPTAYSTRNGKTRAGEAYFLRQGLTTQFWRQFEQQLVVAARELSGDA